MTTEIICGDAREALARFPDGHFHCCVTSPPFWGLRDYGLEPTVWGGDGCEHEWGQPIPGRSQSGSLQGSTLDGAPPGQERRPEWSSAFCRRCNAWRGTLGLEPTPELYVEHLVGVMREVRRVLRNDGVLWLNLGDSYTSGGRKERDPGLSKLHPAFEGERYADGLRPDTPPGLKPKDLVGVPWRVAFALQADGWWLRSDIVWSKPNPMPESVTDRPTRSHEYLFLLTKRERYAYDADAIREPHGDTRSSKAGQNYFSGQAAALRPRGRGGPEHHFHENGRNKRSIWEIATQPFGLEMCAVCRTIYTPAQYRRQRGGSAPRCTYEIGEDDQCCGTKWLAQDGGAVCVACETFYSAKELEHLPRAAKCRKCGSEEWLSHFAVFPEKLVEPCILAGTSEWGCCPECGAPWERKIEVTKSWREDAADNWDQSYLQTKRTLRPTSGGMSQSESHTVGWRPTCEHGAEPVPCRVLDPFAGSGTVGLVAERLGRHSVLIDAKEEYCEMARHRTAQRGLMMEAMS